MIVNNFFNICNLDIFAMLLKHKSIWMYKVNRILAIPICM